MLRWQLFIHNLHQIEVSQKQLFMTFFHKSSPAHERPHGTAVDKHSFQLESVWITELSLLKQNF